MQFSDEIAGFKKFGVVAPRAYNEIYSTHNEISQKQLMTLPLLKNCLEGKIAKISKLQEKIGKIRSKAVSIRQRALVENDVIDVLLENDLLINNEGQSLKKAVESIVDVSDSTVKKKEICHLLIIIFGFAIG